MRSVSHRKGALLVEILVALVLGAVVLTSLAGLATSGVRWTRSLSDRTEAMEVVRTVWAVLDEELRPGRAGRDWFVDGAGVLRIRSFHGIARICGDESAGSMRTVAYRGRRSPDPLRDSVLALGPEGLWRSLNLESSIRSEACEPGAGESLYRWTWNDPDGLQPIVLRAFESSSYHLADAAFRYQGSRGGRQPLTVERLSTSSSFSAAGNNLEVTVSLGAGTAANPRPFTWTAGEALPPR